MIPKNGWLYLRLDASQVMWWMIAIYLLIDSLNGFFAQQMGMNLRLSQMFKMGMLLLGTYILVSHINRKLQLLLAIFAFVMLGPIIKLLADPGSSFFQHELVVAIRMLLFFVVLLFCLDSYSREPEWTRRKAILALEVGFWVVVANVLIGFAGLGFATYPNTGVGFKGFFMAGNELSAVFVLLSTYKLFDTWQKKSLLAYLLMSILVLIIGVSIATKAGVLFAVMVVLLTPFVCLRKRLLTPVSVCLLIVTLFLLIGCAVLAHSWLAQTPLYQRFEFLLGEVGWFGLVFSGRDGFLITYWQSVNDVHGYLPLLFGTDSLLLELEHGKSAVEIDPVDLIILYGLPSMFVILGLAIYSVWFPIKRLALRYYAPALVLANGALFFFAIMAGHVWTSGMLGIGWAVLNSLLLYPLHPASQADRSESHQEHNQCAG